MKQTLHSFWGKCSVFLLCASLTYTSSYSQLSAGTYWEGGLTIAPSNFLGDLGGNAGKGTTFLKDNNFSMTRFFAGGFIAVHPSELFAARLAVNFGKIEGDDAVIKGKGGMEEARRMRNLNFKSSVLEAFVVGEVYPTVLFESDPTDVYRKIRPYAVAGIGVFRFNPKGQDPANGQWVALQPLRTEGQGMAEYPDRKPYKLTQLNVPLGIGVKYYVNDNMALSFEIVHRKTFTDYIDDVSTQYIDESLFYNYLPPAQAAVADRIQNKSPLRAGIGNTFGAGAKRGTPENNDAYYTAGFKISWRLFSGNPWANSTRCPVIRY
ncbi:MAG TPA: hypothetical protein VD996_13985 [Chitinophagaceae bacterium]|nr:hypothetical protein [Chitinophagaceae bacterium]